jgi:hypothetical protein
MHLRICERCKQAFECVTKNPARFCKTCVIVLGVGLGRGARLAARSPRVGAIFRSFTSRDCDIDEREFGHHTD